jgi:hypothetical protein
MSFVRMLIYCSYRSIVANLTNSTDDALQRAAIFVVHKVRDVTIPRDSSYFSIYFVKYTIY